MPWSLRKTAIRDRERDLRGDRPVAPQIRTAGRVRQAAGGMKASSLPRNSMPILRNEEAR